jgi:hypothetical protein
LPDLDFLDGAYRNIRGGGAHNFVRDIQTINLHPRGAAVAADHGAGGKSALGGRQHRTVEQLHSGLKRGQIQKLAVRGYLLHLPGNDRALYFRGFRVHQFGRRSDHA